jgi:hypothetical protein
VEQFATDEVEKIRELREHERVISADFNDRSTKAFSAYETFGPAARRLLLPPWSCERWRRSETLTG